MKKLLLPILALFSFSITAQNVPSYVPTNGLVGWWPFNGNANDESGNGNDGNNNGAALTTDRFGSSNSAFLFNGQTVPSTNNTSVQVDCYVHVPNYTTTFSNAITISSWINYDNNNQSPYGGDPLVVKRNGNTIDFDYSISNHKISTHLGPVAGLTDTTYLNLNSWYNLVFVYDGINSNFYVNGVLSSQTNSSGSLDNNWTDLYFGRYVYQGGLTHYFYYNGKIDDIGIWNRALSAAEIQKLYSSCNTSVSINNIPDQNICSGESVTLTASASTMPQDNMVITGVFDGPLTGGLPKGIELYVINDINDLSEYGVGSANNGGGSDGEEFTFPFASATAGQYIYLSSDSATFNQWFGFNADYITSAVNINGDDAIELFYVSNVIDVFGDINVDGNGEPWEYLDGWAYRNSSTGPDGSVFSLSSWSFSGPNALDGEASNATAVSPIPTGNFVHNGSSTINTYTIDVTASGAMDYTFAGSFSGADPAINVNLGDTLIFIVNTPGHPFWINLVQGTGSSNGVAVANNGTSSGTITWVPTVAGTYFYNCEFHSMMTGTITVGPPAVTYVWDNGVNDGVSFTPIATSDYIVTATELSGCTASDTVKVSVLNVEIQPNDPTICFGDSVELATPLVCNQISGFDYLGKLNNNCYYRYNSTTTWSQGQNIAQSNGGELVSINDLNESDFLNQSLGNSLTAPHGNYSVWIGLIDGNNTWTDGSSLNYTNYDGSYTPSNGDYMFIQTNGLWDNSDNQGLSATNGNGIYPVIEINSASNILWSTTDTTNAITVSPTQTTDYTVTVDNGNSVCMDSVTVLVSNPMVSLGDTLSFCNQDSLLLDAGAGYNYYSWNTGDTTQTIYASQSGDYAATVGDSTAINNDYSLSFDGVDDNLVISHKNDYTYTQNGLTIQFDLKPYNLNDPNSPSADYLIWKIDESSGDGLNGKGFDIGFNNSGLFFRWSQSGNSSISTTVYTIDSSNLNFTVFQSIAFVTTNNSLQAYVNGVFIGETILPSIFNTLDFGTSDIYIGKPQAPASGYIGPVQADFDNLQIWSIALTQQEIQTYMNCPPVGNETGLVGYWNFEEGSGSAAIDQTANGNDGTINGATWSTDVPNQVCLGCTATDSVYVQEDALPTVSAGADQTVCSGDFTTLLGSGALSYSWDNGVLDGTSFTPTSTLTYSVTGTDANGCENTDQVDVVVNALPAVDAGADQTICLQDTVVLNGSGALSYSWDNGVTDGAYFIPATTATYTVTGTDANGCVNTDQVDVIVNSLPAVNAGADVAVCVGDSLVLNGAGAVTYSWDNGITDGVYFVPLFTNTYTVIGSDTNGCVNFDQVDVTVNPLPTVSAGADQTVCEGDPITLSGSGALSYVWDNGITDGVTFNATVTTTFTVTGTDANGCSNTDDIVITVTPAPSVVAIAATDTVCVNWESIILTSSPIGGVFSGPGVTDDRFYPLNAGVGTHQIVYSYTDSITGCTGTDTITVVVLECTAIVDNNSIVIDLYPNPTNGLFTLKMDRQLKGRVEITNNIGQVVIDKAITGTNMQFDLSLENSRGVYFVKVYSVEGELLKLEKILYQ